MLGADAATDDVRRDDARVCAPGSLDAGAVAGAIVVCERGRVGRTDKSRAVALADGVGMVLVNDRRGSVDLDVHSVPTVHLDATTGARLVRWVRAHPDQRLRLRPTGLQRRPARVAALSPTGALAAGVLKPDVLAPATAVLGAVPGTGSADNWAVVAGTSAATAYTAGVAASLLGDAGWTAAEVRSALATTAAPVDGADALRTGAGRLRPDRARAPGLAYLVEPGDYRAWLRGELTDLNTPSALLDDDVTTLDAHRHQHDRPPDLLLLVGARASARASRSRPLRCAWVRARARRTRSRSRSAAPRSTTASSCGAARVAR